MNWLTLAPIGGAVFAFLWIVFFSYRPGIMEDAQADAWHMMMDYLHAEDLTVSNHACAMDEVLDSYDYWPLFWNWKATTVDELYPDLISRLELALLYDGVNTNAVR